MHKRLRLGLACQLGLALVVTAAPARAESPEGARERLVVQARVAVKEGRLADSREIWMAIWKLDQGQVAACNIGAISYRIGENPTAVRWLSLCKDIMRPPKTAEERAAHESRLVDLARARQRVGELRISAPAGAAIAVDNEPAAFAPDKTVPVDPGRHVVSATLNGAAVTAEINVPRGEMRDVTLTFPPPEQKKPAPAKAPRVAAGPIKPAEDKPSTAIIVGGAAASAVALGLGIALRVVSDDAEDSRNAAAIAASPLGCYSLLIRGCAQAREYEQTMNATRNGSTWSFIVGGALSAATLAYAFWPRHHAEIAVSSDRLTVTGTF